MFAMRAEAALGRATPRTAPHPGKAATSSQQKPHIEGKQGSSSAAPKVDVNVSRMKDQLCTIWLQRSCCSAVSSTAVQHQLRETLQQLASAGGNPVADLADSLPQVLQVQLRSMPGRSSGGVARLDLHEANATLFRTMDACLKCRMLHSLGGPHSADASHPPGSDRKATRGTWGGSIGLSAWLQHRRWQLNTKTL